MKINKGIKAPVQAGIVDFKGIFQDRIRPDFPLSTTYPVRTMRKRIPAGSKLPVLLSTEEIADMQEHTFVDPDCVSGGIVQDDGSFRFDLSLDEIEEIQGYIAASANHCEDRKLRKRLDRIFSKLQGFLDSFDDQGRPRPSPFQSPPTITPPDGPHSSGGSES